MMKRQEIQWGQRVSLTVLLAMLMLMVSLTMLQWNAQAKVKSSGAGCGGILNDIIAEADSGDTIILMVPPWPDGAFITNNVTLQGGWIQVGPTCTITDGTDLSNFQFVGPLTRSTLSVAGPVIEIDPSVVSLTLQHLILENAGGNPAQGGGISGVISNGARVLLDNLVISNSTVNDRGGGLYLEVRGGSRLVISGSQFIANSAGGGATSTGGGFEVHLYDNSELLIDNTQVASNTAFDGNGGGGRIVIHNSGRVTVTNSSFFGNQAPNGNGGGLSIESVGSGPAEAWLIGAVITGNTAQANPNLHLSGTGLTTYILDKKFFLPIVFKNSSP
jgi:hypothetical protein